MIQHASGSFDVSLTPKSPDEGGENPAIARLLIEKQFHGELQASSRGQMLAVGTDIHGSAGYVAMERVTGKLLERSGSFALQHSGTMTRGVPQLDISVVPDSGTGQLAGIEGRMSIDIVDGKHYYGFDFSFAAAR